MSFQKTIQKEIDCSGIGIHSGKAVSMKIKPARFILAYTSLELIYNLNQ